MPDIYAALKHHFGYTTFRPLQEAIINRVLQQEDTFVLMPTGGGKSLCYQLPSIVMNGTTIVVSPLISLMKDQVDALLQNGIKAGFLNSSQTSEAYQQVTDELLSGELKLLYVAPERLVQKAFLEMLQKIRINFFAIDEAHCISQWGHDFRPEYRRLNHIRESFPDKAVIALTATATPRVREDITSRLKLHQAEIFQASFNRPNLSYTILPKENPYDQLKAIIDRHASESGIIYCQSRATVDTVASYLQDLGLRALPYHAGLSDDIRHNHQERFIREDTDIIVATIAFGMGIDKPNVRYVIHFNVPKTLEHYYQETGRAGRDGLASECIMLFTQADRFTQERFIREMEDQQEQIIALSQLNQMFDFAQSTSCRRVHILNYFGEVSESNSCASCDNCLNPRDRFDGTVIAQKILSCVYHLRGRFGISHLVAILSGSKSQKLLDYNHHKLSTHGIIKDYSKNHIKSFIYELIHQGYLTQSPDQYALIGLTKKSVPVLQINEQVFLIKPADEVIKQQTSDRDTVVNNELFQHLRALRKSLADEESVPPYVIFSDATLKEMAAFIPTTTKELRSIKGVGDKKLSSYGDLFIAAITEFVQKRN